MGTAPDSPQLPRLAIVGTGIAGLGCAWFLRDRFDLTLFEQNGYAGGHTNTIDVAHATHPVAFDTGFMVFNHVTYPNLSRLFRELGVETKPTAMSFSVQHVPANLEYNGGSLHLLFGQRRLFFIQPPLPHKADDIAEEAFRVRVGRR